MERKLATVRRIASVTPIEGADRIVLAKLENLGWQCVTQKSNDFKPGDYCVYFEIDSMIPTVPPFDFLKKKPEDTVARLKTIRLKKQLSQGLILPLNICTANGKSLLPKGTPFVAGDDVDVRDYHVFVEEGDDVTDFFGITKYEPEIPAQLAGKVRGNFPSFLVKTDETRIQSCPGVLTRHKGKKFYITEKIDGSSMTVYWYRNSDGLKFGLPVKLDAETHFGICSRNLDLENTEDNAFWKCALKYSMRDAMLHYGKPIAIQGEMYGDGICGNKLKQPGLNFRMFNAFDLETKSFLNFNEFKQLASDLNLETVPILDDNFVLDHTVDQLVTWSVGKSAINPTAWREGIVIRPLIEDVDSDVGRLSFKVINPEFLLHHGE